MKTSEHQTELNEFIIWDSKFKKFIEPSLEIIITTKDGLLKGINGGSGFVEDWEAFNYIGKKDINNKKIYANCSIIEFVISNKLFIGPFEYDNDRLAYGINTKAGWLKYDVFDISNLKIIGTLNENPELLEMK